MTSTTPSTRPATVAASAPTLSGGQSNSTRSPASPRSSKTSRPRADSSRPDRLGTCGPEGIRPTLDMPVAWTLSSSVAPPTMNVVSPGDSGEVASGRKNACCDGRLRSASTTITWLPAVALTRASWLTVVDLPSTGAKLVTAIVRSGRSPWVNCRLVRRTRKDSVNVAAAMSPRPRRGTRARIGRSTTFSRSSTRRIRRSKRSTQRGEAEADGQAEQQRQDRVELGLGARRRVGHRRGVGHRQRDLGDGRQRGLDVGA